MFEQLEFESNFDVDISINAVDITTDGFELRYRLGGPSRVQNLRVRWVSYIDKNVQQIIKDLTFLDLKQTRQGDQGSGEREDCFDILPKGTILPFLNDFKINPNGFYSLSIDIKGNQLCISTRQQTILRFIKVALIICNDPLTITKMSGIDATGFNYFEDISSTGIRRINYKLKLPEALSSQDLLLIQGIRGFDANAKQNLSISLEDYRMEDDQYHMNFGPSKWIIQLENYSLVFALDFSVLIRRQSLPTLINDQMANEKKYLTIKTRRNKI